MRNRTRLDQAPAALRLAHRISAMELTDMRARVLFRSSSIAIALLFAEPASLDENMVHTMPAQRLARGALTGEDTNNQMSMQFFGTTTLVFRDERNAVMIDGFFSRPSILKVALGKLEPDMCRIDYALRKAGVNHLDAVLVAHSHYDHAMDAAVVAGLTCATLYGSRSTRFIAEGQGLPSERNVLLDMQQHEVGAFKFTAFESLHSVPVRFSGDISSKMKPPVRARAYREGGSYSFLIEHDGWRAIVHPSANYREGMYGEIKVNTVFLSLGALGARDQAFVESYWHEVVVKTGAQQVIPIHWDNFTLPLDRPLKPMPFDSIDEAMSMIRELADRDGIPVVYLPRFEPVDKKARRIFPNWARKDHALPSCPESERR